MFCSLEQKKLPTLPPDPALCEKQYCWKIAEAKRRDPKATSLSFSSEQKTFPLVDACELQKRPDRSQYWLPPLNIDSFQYEWIKPMQLMPNPSHLNATVEGGRFYSTYCATYFFGNQLRQVMVKQIPLCFRQCSLQERKGHKKMLDDILFSKTVKIGDADVRSLPMHLRILWTLLFHCQLKLPTPEIVGFCVTDQYLSVVQPCYTSLQTLLNEHTLCETINGDGGSLPPESWIKLLHNILAVIEQFHDHKEIIHDLTPANILLDDHFHVYLSDAGINDSVFEDEDSKTYANDFLASKMRCKNLSSRALDNPPCSATDVYSLGILLFHIWNNGQTDVSMTKVRSLDEHGMMLKRLEAATPPLPEELFAVIQRCVGEPETRPSVADIRLFLDRWYREMADKVTDNVNFQPRKRMRTQRHCK
jgi:hypothetical protein